MAISQQQRTDLLTLLVGMFDAAPGSDILDELANGIDAGNTVEQYAANLINSSEFTGIYSRALTAEEFASSFVANLIGDTVDAATTAEAEAFVAGRLNAGASRDVVILEALNALSSVAEDDATWGAAAAQLNNKVEVAEYFGTQSQYTGLTLSQMQTALSGVTSDDATVTAKKEAIDAGDLEGVGTSGQTFTLTTSVDTLVGTTGNDTFNASVTSTSAVLGGLDSVDGGNGNDTLNITDTSVNADAAYNLPTGLTVSNVETLNVVANGSVGSGAGAAFDVSGMTGLTTFNATAAGDGTTTSNIKAAGTTDVALTVATGATKVVGGKTVSITGGGTADIDDAAGATGTTLTSVSLTNVGTAGGVTSTLDGNGITSVTLSGVAAAANTVTVTNSTANHSLTINAAGTGYTTAAATTAAATVVNDTAATSLTVNTTAKSALNVAGSSAAKSVTLTGAGDLDLATTAAATTAIDGSAATGNLSLNTLGTTVTSVKTGSGNDSFTTATTAKQTVETGAGNDTVTLGAAVAAGSTINLGAGDDKLLVNGGSVAASTTTATTVIDGGEGTDTVAASLINAANAKQFVNFDAIDVSSATTTALDVELMTASTITSLTLNGGTGGATVNNVAAGVGLSVSGSNTGTTTIGVKGATATSATTDSFTTTFAGTAASTATASAPTAVAAGTVVTNGVETLNIVSGGTGFVSNDITVTDSTLQSLVITGDKAIDVDFAGTNGTVVSNVGGVSSIDASAATGVVTLDTANLTVATAGLTVTTGSANDVITLAQKATVVAGAGNDTITSAAAGGTFTGGAGNDKFDVSAAVATGVTEATAILSTITDFAAGDSIKLLAGNTAGTLGSAQALASTVTNLDQALAQASMTDVANEVSWFQYGNNTYIVANDGAAGIGAGDLVVKLTGLVDLSTATLDGTTDYLTL